MERLTDGKVPCADGIFTHAPIDCGQDIEAVMADLRALTAAIIGRGHIPVTLGGEHSVSYGAVMGVVDALDAIGAGAYRRACRFSQCLSRA